MTDQMTDQRLDREIRAFLRWQADQLAGAPTAMEMAIRISTHGRTRPAGLRGSPRLVWVALAALLVMTLVGAAVIGALSQRPVLKAPFPSFESHPTARLTWTQSSLDQDWPAPVRAEVGGSGVVEYSPGEISYRDPDGDIGASVATWIDIGEIRIIARPPDAPGAGAVDLVIQTSYGKAIPKPQPDPREQWIAYGVVLDVNEDGVPDIRLGIDNMPVSEHRAWRTNLDSGVTVSAAGAPYGFVGNTYFDTYYPGEAQTGGTRLGIDMPGGETYRFYLWAAVIAEGSVVATDYAPDAGWFDPWP